MKHYGFLKSAYVVFCHSKYKVESHIKNRFLFLINSGRHEQDVRYAVNQLLNHVLWEDKDAVHMGFEKWKKENLPIKLEALDFYSENCETSCRCKMCNINKKWSEIYEGKRPELC